MAYYFVTVVDELWLHGNFPERFHMNYLIRNTATLRVLSTFVCVTTLAACGGGNETTDMTMASSSSKSVVQPSPSAVAPATATSTPEAANLPSATASLISRSLVSRGTASTTPSGTTTIGETDIRLESIDTNITQSNVPVTFGQVFSIGAIMPDTRLVGRLDDGSEFPLQMDVKATHADGSVRHAVLSAVVPSLAAGQLRTISLVKSTAAPFASQVTTANALNSGFTASVDATLNGVRYSASADSLLKKGTGVSTWLSGPVANEWHVNTPLMTASGVAHPHLTARFAIRWYESVKKARIDVTVENNWAYAPAPQNFTYDARVTVGGKAVYDKAALTHFHHARWRKVFWWGDAPKINVKHNTAYLIKTGAVPNYDQTVSIPETTLAESGAAWARSTTEPMGVGFAQSYMPATGGRMDIGLLPGWAASHVLSMDKRSRDITLGTGDLAGSWSIHYRDQKTDRPVSVIDYPYMTLLGRGSDTRNKTTGQYEAFPGCAAADLCKSPYTADSSHQPSLAYLPYLLTGDYYYLEELQFWTMWNILSPNPGYREYAKGIIQRTQVRGQAWSLRTLAQAAYITPDNDRLKSHFVQFMSNNLDWYSNLYLNPATTNKLGVITNGSALVYNSDRGISPWQDDFFTAALGHTAELGFTKAAELLKWKTKFVVDRMTAPGACWIGASMYSMNIRASETSPYYSTVGEAFAATNSVYTTFACNSPAMATALKLKVGEMVGYASGPMGYPSNMQPALAYGAEVGGDIGKQAWSIFANRTVKPDYRNAPQFAIVPRQ